MDLEANGRYSGAQGRNRTTDTAIFSRMLYQLSYLGAARRKAGRRRFIVRPGGHVHPAKTTIPETQRADRTLVQRRAVGRARKDEGWPRHGSWFETPLPGPRHQGETTTGAPSYVVRLSPLLVALAWKAALAAGNG